MYGCATARYKTSKIQNLKHMSAIRAAILHSRFELFSRELQLSYRGRTRSSRALSVSEGCIQQHGKRVGCNQLTVLRSEAGAVSNIAEWEAISEKSTLNAQHAQGKDRIRSSPDRTMSERQAKAANKTRFPPACHLLHIVQGCLRQTNLRVTSLVTAFHY